MFGLHTDVMATKPLCWGARAIYQRVWVNEKHGKRMVETLKATFDLLNDRQTFIRAESVTDDDKAAFVTWLNKTGLPKMRKAVEAAWLEGSSSELIEVVDGGYKIAASPNASYGYLYINAMPL